ncbi:sensor histidine kinase [Virgibacillus sp. SK37]|uniref:sensor histidine kinase n=1 Tax=Virgibacillus sp. SK37 TaxID=403957 RepID=UPI0004D1E295|nr:sensor histidine kinase [Virgibacillus sp. SK37]AIF45588.1 hypothetical protein X953_16795 [Virgibacillus sp. SK37]
MKRKNTLENKIKKYFSLIFFSMLIIVSAIILQYTNKNFQEQSHIYLKSMVRSNLELLDSNFGRLQNLAYVIAGDPTVQAAVAYRNQAEKIDYSIELYNQRNVHEKLRQFKLMPYIKNAVIIGEKGKELYSYKEYLKDNYNFEKQGWFNELNKIEKNSYNNSYFTNFHNTNYLINSKGENTISMVTPIQNMGDYSLKNKSYLLNDIDLSSILLKNPRENGVQLAIHNNQEWLQFPELIDASNEQIKELKKRIKKGEKYFLLHGKSWGEQDLLVVMNTSKTTGWSIVGIKSLTEIRKSEITVLIFIIGLIILSSIIITSVSGMISKTILVPMNRLIIKFNRIAEGDYSVRFEENSSEEINKLSHSAEHMIQNMTALSDKVLLEQKRLSKEQMKALQHQINPHFLNNVLQSIKAFAVNGDTEKISRLTTLLGKMMAYSVYQPYEKVALKTELKYTEQYISIQNIRFENKIHYSIYCEEGLENVRIPKLIIQPLVENSMNHGFKNQMHGFLNISVEKEDQDISIIVTDNGTGISKEEVSDIQQSFISKDTYHAKKSIGLMNVDKRIKSEFGETFGLKIVSDNKRGTTVIITIPNLGEE